MSKFPQRVTFTATLDITTEGLDWEAAAAHVNQGLLKGDLEEDFLLSLVKVTRMEIIEEGS